MNHPAQRGFTLIELMIALVLGLIVIGGVVSVLLSNQQSYRSNQALAQVQDGSRIAFEFLTRDIRQAGLTGCGNTNVANVLNNSPANGGTDWWANWANALQGYAAGATAPVATGTAATQRTTNSDSITLMSAGDSGYSVDAPNSTTAQFKLNEPKPDLQDGDIVIVCDPNQATILQVTNYNASNVTVVHNTGTGTPGNCSKGLGFPTDCSSTNGNPYTYQNNAMLAKLNASYWYIGNNALGTCAASTPQNCSLFRSTISVSSSGGKVNAQPQEQEIVRGVTNMQLGYLQGGTSFVPAASVTNWSQVTAVQVTLTLAVPTNPNNPNDPRVIQRVFTNTIALRNRMG
ncbi:prepilin-type N-terminal cleavage/methylation domain-containing protein [Halothiobacillus sp. DCM-1]|uniref:prepilin-type N-terminal cleavage/methylation domain-containing protein n=1 Tax=Halothiobacillus sp. DCM-1 TaxID=3112558 RepID=UPI00324D60E2